jgi:hypothetical protein
MANCRTYLHRSKGVPPSSRRQIERGRQVPDDMLTKGQAVSEVMQATGYGRQVVEKKMVELEARGVITFEDDPGDTRKKLISRAHVNAVIAALTR